MVVFDASILLFVIPVQNRPTIYSYARVSTDGRSVAAQVAQLWAADADKVVCEAAA
jgi:hypothetical protein